MEDDGSPNHGTVLACFDRVDYLLDSSVLLGRPVAMPKQGTAVDDSRFPRVEIRLEQAGSLILFETVKGGDPLPCRILADPAEFSLFVQRYEHSRHNGIFNQFVHARIDREDSSLLLRGNRFTRRRGSQIETCEVDVKETREILIDRMGYSRVIIDEWEASGALEAGCRAVAAAHQPK